MIRRIIKIDEDKCDGCGLCATACHEGAIEIIDGKARLTRENFCDGLGDCLPSCPTGAISFEMREAPAYDEAAVLASQRAAEGGAHSASSGGGCPGSAVMSIGGVMQGGCPGSAAVTLSPASVSSAGVLGGMTPVKTISGEGGSMLRNWPVQIKLAPVNAPYFDGAKLLVAADCTAYAYAGMHEDFMKGRVTLIGCPKLDAVDYTEKLTEIIRQNNIKSLTVVRMEVPCCGGIQLAAEKALRDSGKFIPWQIVTISRDGRILEQ